MSICIPGSFYSPVDAPYLAGMVNPSSAWFR